MYLEHFGLRELPFSLTPDTQYFLGCPSHREALNLLLFAARSGEGFTKVVGAPRSAANLVGAVSRELGLAPAPGTNSHERLEQLSRLLIELDAAGRQVVLVLDEAQALPMEALESVRLLTNLETERKKLLQVMLFGQPELDQRLADPMLRQLRQRITFSHRLRPLTRSELGVYVEHRLRVAGYRGMRLFGEGSVAALARGSRGIPRLANVLCHKALLVAYGRGDRHVAPYHVRRAVDDTADACRRGRRWLGPWSGRVSR